MSDACIPVVPQWRQRVLQGVSPTSRRHDFQILSQNEVSRLESGQTMKRIPTPHFKSACGENGSPEHPGGGGSRQTGRPGCAPVALHERLHRPAAAAAQAGGQHRPRAVGEGLQRRPYGRVQVQYVLRRDTGRSFRSYLSPQF